MFDGGMAIGRGQHLHHRHLPPRDGDEAVLFFQAGRAAHAVVMALDEHRAMRPSTMAAADSGRGLCQRGSLRPPSCG
jgi:hypothetical protein